jgi:uncharacterized protein DUF2169
LDVENQSPFPARVLTGGVPTGPITLASMARSRGPLPDGVTVRGLLIVKATLAFSGGGWRLAPPEAQFPVWDLDQQGPPFFEKDIMFQKGGVDLVVVGSAVAPGSVVTQMQVSVILGDWSRTLAVFGNRLWTGGQGHFVPSAPEAFETLPITWENAFGGTTVDHEGNQSPFPLNPNGKGYTLPNPQSQVAGVPLPNIEDPAHLIASMEDRPDPVGFGFLPATSGMRLREGVIPRGDGKPDVTPRIYNAAPPGFVFTAYPEGAALEVHGMTRPSPWRAALPPFPARAALRGPAGETPLPLEVDTICLVTDGFLMYLTAKGRFDYDLEHPPDLTAVVYPVEGGA